MSTKYNYEMHRLIALSDVVSEKWRAMNPRHCPVVLRDGDGKSVGACWHYLIDGECPAHGKIYEHNATNDLPAVAGKVRRDVR